VYLYRIVAEAVSPEEDEEGNVVATPGEVFTQVKKMILLK
jgi:hypothetical protein